MEPAIMNSQKRRPSWVETEISGISGRKSGVRYFGEASVAMEVRKGEVRCGKKEVIYNNSGLKGGVDD